LPDFPDWPAATTALEPEDVGTVYFNSASPFDLDVIFAGMTTATPTKVLGYLSYPQQVSAEQPVPAMVIVHGSGGIAAGREHQYAQLLNDHGIAAFVVDYYSPRGITDDINYVVKTSSVTEFDIITDAYAALQLLSTSPLIDAKRIGLIGFSYGGMATRFAMDDRFRQVLAPEHPGFALHVDVYGPCFQNLQTTATNGAPLLTLRGTADHSNDLAACQVREQELRNLGVSVEAHLYEGAGHAWENSVPRFMSESPYLRGCEIRYDERGVAFLNGEQINTYDAAASRPERIAARLSSGGKYSDCLQYGYLVGNDSNTKQQAFRALMAFLNRHFAQ
jgi:dienelactone hydrolase